MKEGDKGTDVIFTIKDRDGAIVDLTGAQSATLYLKLNNGTVVSKAMTFIDRPNGKVSYQVEDGILSDYGTLRMEAEITFDPTNVFRTDVVIEEVKKRLS